MSEEDYYCKMLALQAEENLSQQAAASQHTVRSTAANARCNQTHFMVNKMYSFIKLAFQGTFKTLLNRSESEKKADSMTMGQGWAEVLKSMQAEFPNSNLCNITMCPLNGIGENVKLFYLIIFCGLELQVGIFYNLRH